ncbi:5-methylthioadenosine/S-adenosylhomocysteine deaminase [Bienertia sinuspersici]
MASSYTGNVTLRFWHGGKLNGDGKGGMVYMGGQGKTVVFDFDELCYFDIMKSTKEVGKYSTVNGVYYHVPGLVEFIRGIEEESPIPPHLLVSESEDDEDDPVYVSEKGGASDVKESDMDSEDEFIVNESDIEENEVELLAAKDWVVGESENNDEEYHDGKVPELAATDTNTGGNGYESEYYDTDDDMKTPPNSDDEDAYGRRRSQRGTLLSKDTDFSKFKWEVGQRFATREDFRDAVAKYGIMQDRNILVVVSNKSRRQELGYAFVKNYPFYLYASWHSSKGSYIEIVDTIKTAYKVLVNKTFPYKVKYYPHQLLHGSIYNKTDFDDALEELKEKNPVAATAFKAYNPRLFCRAFMKETIKLDAITNNMAETFNGFIINARTKHLIHMMEDIRVALMKRMVVKRKEMEKHNSLLCPRIQSLLEKEKHKASYYEVIPSTDNSFNVIHDLDQVVVDIEKRTSDQFVDHYYRREAYLRSYAGSIPPTEGKKPRGRPRKEETLANTPLENDATTRHSITSHPTQLRRGGKMILTGEGSKSAANGRVKRGGGRGVEVVGDLEMEVVKVVEVLDIEVAEVVKTQEVELAEVEEGE